MIHTLDARAIVQQLGTPEDLDSCNEVRSLISGAPLLVGVLFALPKRTDESDYCNAVSTLKKELLSVYVGFSISHEYSDVLHETSAVQAGEASDHQQQKRITCTTSGVLVSYVTSMTISKQFYNTPLQLLITLRTEGQERKIAVQRQMMGEKEANVRALMDLNRYRPQAVLERTLSAPVQFVYPIGVTFQVREIGSDRTILSLKICNLLPTATIVVRDVTFHLDRITSTGNGSDRGGYVNSRNRMFHFTPMLCSISGDAGAERAGESPLPVIAPLEEYTLLYSVTVNPEFTEDMLHAAQYCSPCTVYWSTVDNKGAAAASTDLGGKGSSDLGEDESTEPVSEARNVTDVGVEVTRLLCSTAGARCGGVYEFDCTAVWTLGSSYIKDNAAGKAGMGAALQVQVQVQVEVTVQGPAVVRVNEAFALLLSVTNTSGVALQRAVLCAPSSTHSGQGTAGVSYVVHETETHLSDIAPLATAAVVLTVTALQPGRLLVSDIYITATGRSPLLSTQYRLKSPFQALAEEELVAVDF